MMNPPQQEVVLEVEGWGKWWGVSGGGRRLPGKVPERQGLLVIRVAVQLRGAMGAIYHCTQQAEFQIIFIYCFLVDYVFFFFIV